MTADEVVSLGGFTSRSFGNAKYISEPSQALKTMSLKAHILCSSGSEIHGIVFREPSSSQKWKTLQSYLGSA